MEEKIKELKKELSKLSGIDFFNPKYRDVFKRYFNETDEAKEVNVEEAKADDAVADEDVTTKAEKVIEDIAEDKTKDIEGEKPDYEGTSKDETELTEAIEKDKKADEIIQETKNEEEETAGKEAPTAEETNSEKEQVPTEEEAAAESVNINDKLLETQLELELVRAGVREDRINVAKRLFLPEIQANGNIELIKELVAQYPEWISKQGKAAGFGMPIGDKSDGLTAEERRLKAFGIDPRG